MSKVSPLFIVQARAAGAIVASASLLTPLMEQLKPVSVKETFQKRSVAKLSAETEESGNSYVLVPSENTHLVLAWSLVNKSTLVDAY